MPHKVIPMYGLGAGAYKARVQHFGVYLSKTAWTLGPLCGKRAKKSASHSIYLVSV